MIVQIYSKTVYNVTKLEHISKEIYENPIILEFESLAEFHKYRKQLQWKEQKLLNKNAKNKEDIQRVEIHFALRKLI